MGTLDIDKGDIPIKLCPMCDEEHLCVEGGTVGKLTVYCIEGIFVKK